MWQRWVNRSSNAAVTLPLEDLVPFPEGKVARDQNAPTLIPVGEDLEEQLGAGSVKLM